MINWTAFDWQSFATLSAGLLAVGGAVIVGWRQTTLLKKQSEISELTLRHELFERRYAVYEATRELLGSIVSHADSPSMEIEQRFVRMMGESRFLFRPSVYDDLQAIWRRNCQFHALKAQMGASYRNSGHYGEGNPQREADLLRAFVDDLTNLIDLFGYEMRLTN